MNTVRSFGIFLLFVMGLTSCKSEFEKLRASDNVDLVYRKALDYYKKEDYYKAQVLMEQILGRYRGKAEAEELYFKYAYTHYYLNNYILAASYFQNFANTYVTSSLREEAAYLSAYSNYQQSPNYKLDQTYTYKSIDELQNFINTYPNSKRVKDANKLIDELRAKLEIKAYEEGELYFNMKNYQAANNTFLNMLKDFPDSKKVEQIRYMIVKSDYLLAFNSVYSKRLERFEATQLACEYFLNKFPSSKYGKEVKSVLKETKQSIKFYSQDGHKVTSTGN